MTVAPDRFEEQKTAARHPLAPLTVAEAGTAARAALEAVGPESRLAYVALAEPPKDVVRGWDGAPVPRAAQAVVYSKRERLTWMVTVSLADAAVTAKVAAPGAQASLTPDEWTGDGERCKADPGFQAALARRGITDLSMVQVDQWPASNFGLEVDKSGRRLTRCVAYVLDGPQANPYARPVENLFAIMDRDTGEVIELHDGEIVPVPRAANRYDAASVAAGGPLRELAPLRILQPDGPGFTVDDGCLRWGPWQLRIGMHPIEGLVLHEVSYVDGDRARPIMYRASLSEMVVPYGSTSMNHWWKNAFDGGDAGLGRMATSLELGCDCLGEIVYLDSVAVGDDGAATAVKNAICLHEEDYGILWKHVDPGNRAAEVRRSRRMVVSSISTVGNYEYGFFWYFYLDGTIQAEVKLTGIIQTQAVVPGTRVPYANPVTAELAGVHHQHIFNYRLDMCLDGPDNSVYEVDAVPVPTGPDNPHGNAFTARVTRLETEQQAQRMAAAEKARYWKIVNEHVTNAAGEPVAYKLVPQHAGTPLLAQPDAAISARAAFGTKHLWVTPYSEQERRAAGDFTNQHPGGDGLPKWTAADRPVADTDIVLWHTIGVTHFCRPEDFPVMPCEYAGFTLKPFGFFDRNPGIDLAPSATDHCGPGQHGASGQHGAAGPNGHANGDGSA